MSNDIGSSPDNHAQCESFTQYDGLFVGTKLLKKHSNKKTSFFPYLLSHIAFGTSFLPLSNRKHFQGHLKPYGEEKRENHVPTVVAYLLDSVRFKLRFSLQGYIWTHGCVSTFRPTSHFFLE